MQEQVQQAIDKMTESGPERGIQVAVYRDGELVVDAVSGVADSATGRPVTPETVFYTYSTGKAMTATIAHLLVERGLFNYDTLVAELWPEFGAHGKQAATVRHVLTHSAGVPQIPLDTTIEDLCDWDRICAAIAAQEPWWEPGTQVGYHAYTFGYIIGEIVRRATGKPISQVLLEDVAGPLGLADELYFGMPVSEHGRLARLEEPAGAADWAASMPTDLPMFKAGPLVTWPGADFGNRSDVLAADIPAGGKNSARAMARLYDSLLGHGVEILPPARVATATALAAEGVDQVFGNPSKWALGWALGLPGGESETAFNMGGVGGSFAFADASTGIAFAFTKNFIAPDFEAASELIRIVMA